MDRTIVITGASRGIGRAAALRFSKEQDKLFLVCKKNTDLLKETAALCEKNGAEACVFTGDLADPSVCARLMQECMERFGIPDVLVNNAADQGIGQGGPLDVAPDAMLAVLRTNVVGGFRVTQEACRRFFAKQETRGCVVFLSSNTARRAIRNRTSYCASKGAINSLVRSLALDLGPLGIRVNCCAPGYINTERWDALDPAVAARRRANCPLGREASGADIAGVVAFLASDDAANMTGEIVTVDGGCSCQHMPADCDG